MRVAVDMDKCSGHGQCNAIAPEVYDLDDGGYCLIPDPEVPAGHEEAARDGAQACPELAITVSA